MEVKFAAEPEYYLRSDYPEHHEQCSDQAACLPLILGCFLRSTAIRIRPAQLTGLDLGTHRPSQRSLGCQAWIIPSTDSSSARLVADSVIRCSVGHLESSRTVAGRACWLVPRIAGSAEMRWQTFQPGHPDQREEGMSFVELYHRACRPGSVTSLTDRVVLGSLDSLVGVGLLQKYLKAFQLHWPTTSPSSAFPVGGPCRPWDSASEDQGIVEPSSFHPGPSGLQFHPTLGCSSELGISSSS